MQLGSSIKIRSLKQTSKNFLEEDEMMKIAKPNLSLQLIVALVVILGLSTTAQAKNRTKATFKPTYKAEKCDCLGYEKDIPTFLSDLNGGSADIWGEGSSQKEASQKARNMCVESYRAFASLDKKKQDDVTESGCQFFRSTQDGDWESI